MEYTLREAAEYLGYSTEYTRLLARQGKLAYRRTDGFHFRFNIEELDKFIAARNSRRKRIMRPQHQPQQQPQPQKGEKL